MSAQRACLNCERALRPWNATADGHHGTLRTVALTETRGKRGISKILPLTEPTPAAQQHPQPTPEQVLESTDLDQLRAWWMAGDAEMRELIDTRVLVLKETEGQVSES